MSTRVSEPIASAIAWMILGEVMRRHGGRSDLRVLEMHPGGGMYNLLTVFRLPNERSHVYRGDADRLGHLDLASGKSRGSDDLSEPGDWLYTWLETGDLELVSRETCRTFRLPSGSELPRENARIFAARLMAAMLASQLHSRGYLHARMGFADTSGYGGGIRPDMEQFVQLLRSEALTPEECAADCWLLYEGPKSRLVGALRTDGALSSAEQPNEVVELFRRYQSTTDLRSSTNEALAALGL